MLAKTDALVAGDGLIKNRKYEFKDEVEDQIEVQRANGQFVSQNYVANKKQIADQLYIIRHEEELFRQQMRLKKRSRILENTEM